MTDRSAVDGFLAEKSLAVVGVSRGSGKFGNAVARTLRMKGYRVFAINPRADEIDGEPCYPNLASLPEPVGGVVMVVPPAVTEKVVGEAVRAGIRRAWMQPGAESPEAIELCVKNDISVVYQECIMVAVRARNHEEKNTAGH